MKNKVKDKEKLVINRFQGVIYTFNGLFSEMPKVN